MVARPFELSGVRCRRERGDILITRLSQTEARELLQTSHIGRLGCVVDGGPYVIPVNFIFENDSIYIHSLPGLKVEAMRAQPRVCLQADRIDSDSHWKSVIAYGNSSEVEGTPEREALLENLLTCFPLMTPVESNITTGTPPHIILFCIRVDKITGLGES